MVSRSWARSWQGLAALALWPAMAVAAGSAAADFYVRDLPGVPKDVPPIKMHAGHIEVSPEHNGNLFFWHFQNKHIANKQRTVIWVNGGPGCSSEDGALMEIGPYRVKDEETLVLNNGSWNEFANLLFVDNPVGTGFSYVDTDSYLHELTEMANDFVTFLEKFFAIFPEYDQDDIYIAGESYAGQHIPYIAKAILDRNKKVSTDKKWSLEGLLIGNGWISAYDQSDSYLKFALEKNLVEKGSIKAQQIQNMQRVCDQELATDPDRVDYSNCEAILNKLLEVTRNGEGDDACYNMYDVRLKDSYPSCGMNWPPDLKQVGPYLRRFDVISALNLNKQLNTGWQECNGRVSGAFRNKNTKSSKTILPEVLEKVPILMFSGAEDLICNHIGTEQLISNLEWNGGRGFEVTPGTWAPRREWTFEGENAGFWQEARNLTYVLFNGASHMVPFDYPRRSRDMLDRFMRIDISSIGGVPSDSRIDGEKGPDTSVGGATNNTQSHDEEAKKKLNAAKWQAYQRSGEVVLALMVIGGLIGGFILWRRRRRVASYSALSGQETTERGGSALSVFQQRQDRQDIEAAAFDETTVDNIPLQESIEDHSKYSVGDDSEEEEDGTSSDGKGKATQ